MKGKLMSHYCMDNVCDWEETSHKIRDEIRCSNCSGPVMSIDQSEQSVMMRGGDKMSKEIQAAAKDKIKELLEKYDVSYIDYSVSDDEYMICLGKEKC